MSPSRSPVREHFNVGDYPEYVDFDANEQRFLHAREVVDELKIDLDNICIKMSESMNILKDTSRDEPIIGKIEEWGNGATARLYFTLNEMRRAYERI